MPKVPSLPVVEENKCSYAYMMRPEPSENLGPIKMQYDEVFGRKVKVRKMLVGMIRNAKQENKKEVEVFLEPYPHMRVYKAKDLQGWYKGKEEKSAVRPRPCFTESILTQPYSGTCTNKCLFCYLDSGVRGYRATGLVAVPLNYGAQVEKQLSTMHRAAAGYITSFHEPFNPLERVYHNSQMTAEAFTAVGLPIFFLSRLRYPDWAIDELTKNKYSYAQKSINTPSAEDWHKLSPATPPLEKQLEDLRKLRDRGIYISIQVNPIVPGVTSNEQIIELFQLLAKNGANHVIVKFLEGAYSWVPAMTKKMIDNFGERGKRFAGLFTQNIGGERTVDEEYRMQAHDIFVKEATKCGLTYSTCYEYRWKRDKSGNIVNKTGISIGPEVTTSDQCHGRRVPVFCRDTLEEKFHEVKECPKTGCLYCADNNGGSPHCNDSLMGKATALRIRDFRKPW
jgi:DNA repair photolyase